MAHVDILRPDSQGVGGDLCHRGFKPLAVVLVVGMLLGLGLGWRAGPVDVAAPARLVVGLQEMIMPERSPPLLLRVDADLEAFSRKANR